MCIYYSQKNVHVFNDRVFVRKYYFCTKKANDATAVIDINCR